MRNSCAAHESFRNRSRAAHPRVGVGVGVGVGVIHAFRLTSANHGLWITRRGPSPNDRDEWMAADAARFGDVR